MTLREYFLKIICVIPFSEGGAPYLWDQLRNALQNRFLEFIKKNPASEAILKELYESLTGERL